MTPGRRSTQLLVERGLAGLEVVRLKGGDPFVFGRGGEEAEACRDAGVAVRGRARASPSAIAAAAYAGIPVTHRGAVDELHRRDRARGPDQGRRPTPTGTRSRAVGRHARGPHGRGPHRRDREGADRGRPRREHAGRRGALRHATRAAHGARHARRRSPTLGVESPSAIVVGDVAGARLRVVRAPPAVRPHGSWSPGPASRRASSAPGSRQLGADGDRAAGDRARADRLRAARPRRLRRGSVFTSANGVDAFFDRGLAPAGSRRARAGAGVRVAAIGPGTAAALARRGLRADLVPERFVAESLLEAFPARRPPARVLLARAETARDVLPDGLAEKRLRRSRCSPVYRTVPVAARSRRSLDRVRAGEVDAITFTSSSTVDNFCDAVGRGRRTRNRRSSRSVR